MLTEIKIIFKYLKKLTRFQVGTPYIVSSFNEKSTKNLNNIKAFKKSI